MELPSKISIEEFLDKKRDYSPFLVHLTRDEKDTHGNIIVPADDILDIIIDQGELQACNHFCLFSYNLENCDNSIKNLFRVTCFTETPIDQIELLLQKVEGKTKEFTEYGLVFKKKFIQEKGGNPVFYVSKNLYDILWDVYHDALNNCFSKQENKFLALVNKFDAKTDFSWEREWRIVGNLQFKSEELFCALCPEDKIETFSEKHPKVVFISVHWGINKILDELIKNAKLLNRELPF